MSNLCRSRAGAGHARLAYKGESTAIPGVAGDFCPACGESILDAAESARASAMMLDFNKQVNASIVDPEFISY